MKALEILLIYKLHQPDPSLCHLEHPLSPRIVLSYQLFNVYFLFSLLSLLIILNLFIIFLLYHRFEIIVLLKHMRCILALIGD